MRVLPSVAAQSLQVAADQMVTGNVIPRMLLVIYQGTRPAAITDPATPSDELARITFVLNDEYDMQTDPDAVRAVLNPETPMLASATGDATYFRIYNRNNVAIFEGSITDRDGDGDMKLPIVHVVMGVFVRGVNLAIKLPTSL